MKQACSNELSLSNLTATKVRWPPTTARLTKGTSGTRLRRGTRLPYRRRCLARLRGFADLPERNQPLSTPFAIWQRVRDSNPCTGLERALMYLSNSLISSKFCVIPFYVAVLVAHIVFANFVSLFLASIPADLRQGLRNRALIGVGFFSLESVLAARR